MLVKICSKLSFRFGGLITLFRRKSTGPNGHRRDGNHSSAHRKEGKSISQRGQSQGERTGNQIRQGKLQLGRTSRKTEQNAARKNKTEQSAARENKQGRTRPSKMQQGRTRKTDTRQQGERERPRAPADIQKDRRHSKRLKSSARVFILSPSALCLSHSSRERCLKTVEEIVRDLNACGIREDPVVHADGKGCDG